MVSEAFTGLEDASIAKFTDPFSSMQVSFVVKPVVSLFKGMGSLATIFEGAYVGAYIAENMFSV